jgi:hypothetical protein
VNDNDLRKDVKRAGGWLENNEQMFDSQLTCVPFRSWWSPLDHADLTFNWRVGDFQMRAKRRRLRVEFRT